MPPTPSNAPLPANVTKEAQKPIIESLSTTKSAAIIMHSSANDPSGTTGGSNGSAPKAQLGLVALMPHFAQLSQAVQQGFQQPQDLQPQINYGTPLPLGMNMG
ncbi:hypothetical protein BGX21_007561, partial [Mortierella sp. AD011]